VIGDCSLSHAGPWSVAAWTAREREKIGVDVERVSHRLHRAAGAFVSPEDRAGPLRERTEQLAIWWCLKEAASKALGLGLGAGLAEIRCVELEQGMHQVTHASGAKMAGWHTLFDGFVIAVCGCRTAD
jgi:phosphopantetheinyl transferase